MKKAIRFLSLLLVISLLYGLLLPASALSYGASSTLNGNGNYDSNWTYWSQGASSYEKMRKVGCYVVAIAKVMAEAGLKSSTDFDPDDLFMWCCDNDYLNSKYAVKSVNDIIQNYSGVKVTISDTGYLSKAMSYDTTNAKVMRLLENGYYVIVQKPGHFMYVHREKSINQGKTVISNSQTDIYDSSSGHGFKRGTDFAARLCKPLKDRNDKNQIRRIIAVKSAGSVVKPPEENSNAIVTFSNYQVRKLTETSAEPYATATASSGKVARVGMFIGGSKDSMVELGTDNGTPKPMKNMWYNTNKYGYPLEPGTTYYYQPYAEVNGKRYDGEIQSFTTPGKKYVPEPPMETVVPNPPTEPTYTALVTCNADNLNVRKGPGTNHDKVGSLKRGSKCTVYPNRASGEWTWVMAGDVSGYVFADRLTKFTGNTRTGVVICKADLLNVRKGPGTGYEKVGQIPRGASCTVYLDVKADWYFVTYGDIAGYASKNMIKI